MMIKINRTKKGFTLLELLVALAIAGILAGIAYPTYTDGLVRGRRAEAMSELVRIANLQEQYYADNRTYVKDMLKLGLSANPYISDNGYYSISAIADSDITVDFILTATAAGDQLTSDSECTSFSINHLSQKTAKKASADNTSLCWER
ncbi:MAG: type IV pilus assembly protein PilE [Phenylobacterium sp.]|jgi:type IV pilus assembly protein PilE